MNRRLLVGALLGALLSVTACSSSEGTNDGGFISGDGQVTEYAVDDRTEPIDLTGDTLDGDALDLGDYRGQVVVVNVWGSWCGPCIKEMPLLVEAADELGDRAAFVGINVRDESRENALSFERAAGVDYPSVDGSSDPQVLLAFNGAFNPKTTPTTMVLDTEGRIAAIIRGPVPTRTTLVDVVEDVIAQDGTAGDE